MNEKLKELALKAGLGDHLWLDIPGSEDVQVTEKFAELIVRECADIGNKAYNDIGNYTYIGDKIKQHFGVEE